MREIVLDTETTGTDAEGGDRIVDIGCVELVNHMPTGKTYQVYLNPEREIPEEVIKIHGITNEFVADKPKFAEIVDEFLLVIIIRKFLKKIITKYFIFKIYTY